MQDTGNPLTAAIDGSGFFVLQRNGETLYTRAGQFEFDADGQLVDSGNKAPVLVRTDSTTSTTFNINDYRVYPPKATATVTLTGGLARTGTATFNLPAFTVVDSSGGSQTLTAKFVRDASDPLHWTIEVDDANNKAIGTGDLRFNADGTPVDGSNSISVTLAPADIASSTIKIDCGAANSFAGITDLASGTVSQVTMQKQDGLQLGALTGESFDDKGGLKLTYSNGSTKTPASLLLAQFDEPERLTQIDGGLFTAPANVQPVLSTAETAGLGRVDGGKLEQSNVDLTAQFSNLIIIQRGYQASSQMTSVANEMIQQLLAMDQHP